MFPDYSGSNYVSFVPASFLLSLKFSSGDFYVSACVLVSFLPFACQTAHLRFSRVACNLPLFSPVCQVLPTSFFQTFFHYPFSLPHTPAGTRTPAPECSLKTQRSPRKDRIRSDTESVFHSVCTAHRRGRTGNMYCKQ